MAVHLCKQDFTCNASHHASVASRRFILDGAYGRLKQLVLRKRFRVVQRLPDLLATAAVSASLSSTRWSDMSSGRQRCTVITACSPESDAQAGQQYVSNQAHQDDERHAATADEMQMTRETADPHPEADSTQPAQQQTHVTAAVDAVKEKLDDISAK